MTTLLTSDWLLAGDGHRAGGDGHWGVEAADGGLHPRGADRVLCGHRHDLQRGQEGQDHRVHDRAQHQHAHRHPHRHPRHHPHGERHRAARPAHRGPTGPKILKFCYM